MEGYKISLEHIGFEGPIDLLHELIERKKLHVHDVTLASVADDFIDFVRSRDSFPMEEASHFVLIASTLLLIKSRSLLPSFTLTEEEESRVDDLERQLLLYREMKEKSKKISNLFGEKSSYLIKERKRKDIVVFAPHESITTNSLYMTILSLLEKIPQKSNAVKAKINSVISLQEMITSLADRVEKAISLSFSEFAKTHGAETKNGTHVVDKSAKVSIIVGFLALLELVKRGVVSAKQDSHKNDIVVESSFVGVPKYGSENI